MNTDAPYLNSAVTSLSCAPYSYQWRETLSRGVVVIMVALHCSRHSLEALHAGHITDRLVDKI